MEQETKFEDLIGRDLKGFSIQEYTEVFRTNDEGFKSSSIGFFKDDNIAKAFAQNQTDANWHKTEKAFILTDGKIGFLLGKSVTLLDAEKAALEIRNSALNKLSAEERKLLKI